MLIIVNFFNNKASIFENILEVNSEKLDYIFKDTLNNLIKIPKTNVEYIKIVNS